MSIHESGEMYLESIFVLLKKNGEVRSIDICDYMGYSKPSVSRAVGILKKDGFISVDKSGYITLSRKGEEMAHKIYERHTIISDFLLKIGVDKKTAEDDACRIEHHISDETFEAIKAYSQKMGKSDS